MHALFWALAIGNLIGSAYFNSLLARHLIRVGRKRPQDPPAKSASKEHLINKNLDIAIAAVTISSFVSSLILTRYITGDNKTFLKDTLYAAVYASMAHEWLVVQKSVNWTVFGVAFLVFLVVEYNDVIIHFINLRSWQVPLPSAG